MSLRRVCIVVAATPVILASCVDLGNLSNPSGDAGTPDVDIVETGAAADRCPPGQKTCNGGCVPTNLFEYGCASASCERCSIFGAETTICEDGKCAVGLCQTGRGSCDGNKQNGCEANLATSTTCGSCTSSCPTDNPLCNSGQCVKQCDAGQTQCGTQCVDLAVARDNCGVCGKECAAAKNATGVCVGGKCGFKCANGFGECDSDPSNGCEPLLPYYADGDGDGFGAGAKVGEACTAPPGSSLALGDCLDSNAAVKPGQAAFFFTGYTNAAGKISYDYDCNATEEGEPTKPPGDCATCRVGDYTKVTRANPPPILNVYCGSTSRISTCSSGCSSSSASTLGCR
jgi:hypothetical protein